MSENLTFSAPPDLPACLLDPRILAITSRLMVWDVPSERRELRLVLPSGDSMSLEVPWPRLLIAAVLSFGEGPKLYAIALKRQGRVQAKTPVFHAPLMNIDRSGMLDKVAALPGAIDPRCISEWEQALLSFSFSRVGHDHTIRPADMAPRAEINSYHHSRCWREIARNNLQRFPGQRLVARRQTVVQWLDELQALLRT